MATENIFWDTDLTYLSARVPAVDWTQGFARHWNGDNPTVTHTFNALSFLFPQGEQFFIDAVREVSGNFDFSKHGVLQRAVKGFVAQEASHRFQHAQYNAVLAGQGFENIVEGYIQSLESWSRRHLVPLTNLAMVCAYEHYTAVLGDYILCNPQALQAASPNMALIWGWHSAEETEHKAVCFDLYIAAGGGTLRRLLAFAFVTVNFGIMFARLYFNLLYRDGCLCPRCLPGTAQQAAVFFLGRRGVAWHVLRHSMSYLSPWFHPWNRDNGPQLRNWLKANATGLRNPAKGTE